MPARSPPREATACRSQAAAPSATPARSRASDAVLLRGRRQRDERLGRFDFEPRLFGAGVYIDGAAGTVTNAGAISAVYHGIFMLAGGSVSNAASGSISGQQQRGRFKNQAARSPIPAIFPARVRMAPVSISRTVAPSPTPRPGPSRVTNSVFSSRAVSRNVANYGSISGATYDGIVLGLGGTVTNAAGASITGASTGVYVKYSAAGTVTNSGHIGGTAQEHRRRPCRWRQRHEQFDGLDHGHAHSASSLPAVAAR